jgi:short-subunit dehydrogenase
LITGASAGLGEEFARQLAPQCRRMVLVARRKDRLLDLEDVLRELNPALEVGSLQVDLADAGARRDMVQRLAGTDWTPDLLVNNAGMGDYGEFVSADWDKLHRMIRVNVTALTHMVHAFLPAMLGQERGAIVNLSSLAADLPIPDFGVYAATKAYVTSFSEALRMEVREKGVSVLAVCPGPVKTGFGTVASRGEDEPEQGIREWFYEDREAVVAESLRALEMDRARVYPGWRIALAAAAISLLPIAVIRLLMRNRPRKVAED